MAEERGGAGSGGSPEAGPARRLRRSRDERVIAGVAGGLGAYLGVDPVLVRLGFVVLAVAGGSGILLYLLAWLVIPEEEQGEAGAAPAPGERARAPGGPGPDLAPVVVGAVLIAIGAVLLAQRLIPRFGHVFWPLLLVAIGVAVIVQGARR